MSQGPVTVRLSPGYCLARAEREGRPSSVQRKSVLVTACAAHLTRGIIKRFEGDCAREGFPAATLIQPIIPGILEHYARVCEDQPGEVEVYNSYVVALYKHMAQSCAGPGVPVLDLYAPYDGPNGDPAHPEMAGTDDGVRVSDERDAIIARLLRGLGYESVEP